MIRALQRPLVPETERQWTSTEPRREIASRERSVETPSGARTGRGLAPLLFLALSALAGCSNAVLVGADCFHGVCSGCDESVCADGCCLDGRCVSPSKTACGTGGGTCVDCGDLGDTCGERGECLCGGRECGIGEACSEGECLCGDSAGCGLGQLCVDGTCRCGDGGACLPGTRCLRGDCVCDPLSCAGCCWGDHVTCQPEPSEAACGLAGGACVECLPGEACVGGACSCGEGPRCPPERSDGCSREGDCLCGGDALCPEGTHCQRGACLCSPESCPRGCCQPNACLEPSFEACGAFGAPCQDCSIGGDACSEAGRCTCGGGVACAPPRRCVDGACL